MPVDKVGIRALFVALWVSNFLAVMAKKMAKRVALPVDDVGDEQAIATGGPLKPDSSSIEGSMVQDAQSQPVSDIVGPSGSMPSDVSCIERDQVVLEPDVKVTDGASPLIRCQDGAAESGVAPQLDLLAGPEAPEQANRIANRLVKG